MNEVNHCNGIADVAESYYQSTVIAVIPTLVEYIKYSGFEVNSSDDIRKYINTTKQLPVVGCDPTFINRLCADNEKLDLILLLVRIG